MTKGEPETPSSDAGPKLSSLEMLYKEQWKEYHHTEYMIFVFLAAVAAADVALLQTEARSRLSLPALIIATVLGLTAIFVTQRQIESRHFRIEIIERLGKELLMQHLIRKEAHSAPRLGTSLLLLS